MNIFLKNAGKKYYREWIFRNADLNFSSGQRTAILGANGSGKSTLLQIIAGAVIPNEGEITYEKGGTNISSEEIFQHISFAAPYLELIEEFTLREIIRFHLHFKEPVSNQSETTILESTGLTDKAGQVFKYFSSGMKQRVRLALAIFCNSDLILLDEPCSNLDREGIDWYNRLIGELAGTRTVIVASNDNKDEYAFCNSIIKMSDLKYEKVSGKNSL